MQKGPLWLAELWVGIKDHQKQQANNSLVVVVVVVGVGVGRLSAGVRPNDFVELENINHSAYKQN